MLFNVLLRRHHLCGGVRGTALRLLHAAAEDGARDMIVTDWASIPRPGPCIRRHSSGFAGWKIGCDLASGRFSAIIRIPE